MSKIYKNTVKILINEVIFIIFDELEPFIDHLRQKLSGLESMSEIRSKKSMQLIKK